MHIDFTSCQFLSSASQARHFVEDKGKEVAFVGRSNAGKSSTINCLTQQKKLARVSKTPGRTQLINFFAVQHLISHINNPVLEHPPDIRLTDLPGYGFAKVSLAAKKQWHQLIDYYLRHRKSLQGLVLIMDCRHPLKPFDMQILDWVTQTQLKLHILLNKADKLSRNQALQALHKVRKCLADSEAANKADAQLFSAKHRTGLTDLTLRLNDWLTMDEPTACI